MEPELIKKEEKKNKKLTKLFVTIATMLVIGIGGTFAYYQSTVPFENEFKTGKYGAEVTERFVSPKDWVPGDKTNKDVTVKNTGSICQNARVSYTESWQDKDGNTLPLEKNGVRAAIIEFDNTSDWEKKGNYYYYKEDIMPGQESNSFIKSVTYNPEVNNGYTCETVGNTKTCTVDANGYAGGKYTLNIKVETVQCDKKDEAWPTAAGKVLAQINAKKTCNPSTAVRETGIYNTSREASDVSACVSYFNTAENWDGFGDFLQENGESLQSFCEGTGTAGEHTFQDWLDNAFTTEDLAYFEEHNIITVTREYVGYDEDGAIYLSGTNDCVNFNYVWYSGKLWRIVAIYDDGSMKLVTENNITAIGYNEDNSVSFVGSYVHQWLNEDFLITLYNYNNIIDTTKRWNVTNSNVSNSLEISTRLPKTTMVSSNVGLLNSWEFYNSYRNLGHSNSNGYLNNGYTWWLLNPYNESHVWYVDFSTARSNLRELYYAFGVRPSIVIKSNVEFTGTGTLADPYKIVGDKDVGIEGQGINTRMSGEYIKLSSDANSPVYRIVGTENNTTKIVAMDYADNKSKKPFASNTHDAIYGSETTTDEGTWYSFLNSTWYTSLVGSYGNLFTQGTYYMGCVYPRENYKLGICDRTAFTSSSTTSNCTKTSWTGMFNVGLLRYGEMFATHQSGGIENSVTMWLITNMYEGQIPLIIYADSDTGASTIKSTDEHAARPTLHLKSTVKILSGSGTEQDPYVVGL